MAAFEWLDDVPDEWEPPIDLLEPSRDPIANLAIKMLSCDHLGHRALALVGQFVAEHSLFTLWFLDEGKSKLSAKESLLLTLVPMEQARVVYEAWLRFDGVPLAVGQLDAAELGARRAIACEELEKALQGAIDVFRRATGGGYN
jgi:hypothetical protein